MDFVESSCFDCLNISKQLSQCSTAAFLLDSLVSFKSNSEDTPYLHLNLKLKDTYTLLNVVCINDIPNLLCSDDGLVCAKNMAES